MHRDAQARRRRLAGLGRDPWTRSGVAAGRGVGRHRLCARQPRRAPPAGLGDRPAHQGGTRPQRRGGPSSCATLTRLAPGARCVEVPVAEQPRRAALPVDRAPLRADVRAACRAGPGASSARWSQDLDAIYVNFISGLRDVPGHGAGAAAGLPGADLRATCTACSSACSRTACACCSRLPTRRAWFGCFDVVQMNEDEMRQLSPRSTRAGGAGHRRGRRLLVVTLGPEGAST